MFVCDAAAARTVTAVQGPSDLASGASSAKLGRRRFSLVVFSSIPANLEFLFDRAREFLKTMPVCLQPLEWLT